MTSVCLYFKVHQPYRLKKYQSTDIDVNHCYEDEEADRAAINFAADHCYLPANKIIHRSIREQNRKFRVSFSISGTTLELLIKYRPDVITSFKSLVASGCVELLAETYYHSLSFLHSKKEFQRQTRKHIAFVEEIFHTTPVVFRNTELIYDNQLAGLIAEMGFKGILCEGVERILQGRTINQVYAPPHPGEPALLLRNNELSDDIAFRFGDPNWSAHPLTAEKFAGWLHAHPVNTEVINLFMDYETFGIHKKNESGIFDFLNELPGAVLANRDFQFSTPSDVVPAYNPRDTYHVNKTISWENHSDTPYAWCENVMQNNTLKKIYSIENMVWGSQCNKALETWGRLQAADHFYYMKEEQGEPESGKYQSPFTNAKEAFRNYNNILIDFEISLIKNNIGRSQKKKGFSMPAFNLY